MELLVGDRFLMKKKHPCGASCFEVLRTGGDLRVRCTGCGREIFITRSAFERAVLAPVKPSASQQTTTQEHNT